MKAQAQFTEQFVALIILTVIAFAFIIVVTIQSNASGQSHTSLTGRIPERVEREDRLLTYLTASVKDCEFNPRNLEVTPPELVDLFVQDAKIQETNPRRYYIRDFEQLEGKFENDNNRHYLRVFHTCLLERLGDVSYVLTYETRPIRPLLFHKGIYTEDVPGFVEPVEARFPVQGGFAVLEVQG